MVKWLNLLTKNNIQNPVIIDFKVINKDRLVYIESKRPLNEGVPKILDLENHVSGQLINEIVENAFKLIIENDNIWIGCRDKIIKHNIKTGTNKFYTLKYPIIIMASNNPVDNFLVEFKDRLSDSKEPSNFAKVSISDVLLTDKNVWVGTVPIENPFWKLGGIMHYGGGILLFSKKGIPLLRFYKRKEDVNLISNRVYSINFINGYLWVVTDEGITIIDENGNLGNHLTKENSLPTGVRFLRGIEDTIWVSTIGDIIWTEVPEIGKGNSLADLIKWKRCNQWEVQEYDPITRKWDSLYPIDGKGKISCMYANCFREFKKKIYIGTQQGITVFDRANNQLSNIGLQEDLPDKNIINIDFLGENIIVGTDNGLYFRKN